MEKLLQQHHTLASIRSLMWSYGSPSLVTSATDSRWQDGEWCSWRALELAGLMDRASSAKELDDFLSSEKDQRLGARFERLIEFGLGYLPGVERVKRRLQVYQEKQTLGEFDFIVKDAETGGLEHWEVACKFYLGVPAGFTGRTSSIPSKPGPLSWVGPGKRDSLIKKLTHLTAKQLLLSELPESKSTVSALGEAITNVRALLKGRLFYPLGVSVTQDAVFEFDCPEGLIRMNPEAPVGFWCDEHQLREAQIQSIFSLDKPMWLDPATDRRRLLDVERVVELVHNAPRCVDVVTRDGQSQRWFVVRQGWFDDLVAEA